METSVALRVGCATSRFIAVTTIGSLTATGLCPASYVAEPHEANISQARRANGRASTTDSDPGREDPILRRQLRRVQTPYSRRSRTHQPFSEINSLARANPVHLTVSTLSSLRNGSPTLGQEARLHALIVAVRAVQHREGPTHQRQVPRQNLHQGSHGAAFR